MTRNTTLALALATGLSACGGDRSPGETPSPQPGGRTAGVTIGNAGGGPFDVAVSTIVDASYESWLFQRFPEAATLLANMGQRHMLIVLDQNPWQPVVPQIGLDSRSPGAWSFERLDAIVQPMLAMGDHSPVLMVAAGPAHLYDTANRLVDFAGFAEYAANLVRYYNGPGIALSDGTTLRSPSPHRIEYWSLLNETNLSGDAYLALYDQVVPAMQAVDPELRFVAAEIAWGNPQQVDAFLGPFLGGVRSRVDKLGIHFFPAGQQDPDARVFDYVPECAANVRSLYARLAERPALADVPVWVTSYNSTSWGGLDARPSSAFYAAWAPYMFSRLGQAGARSFQHWEFAANRQFGEVDQETGRPFLSYWVDYWLGRRFSSPGQVLLPVSEQTDPSNVETLAVRQPDGEVVVMVVNHAVASPLDNNGRGVPYTVTVDIGALGSFADATERLIDARTDVTTGPTERRIAFTPRIPLTLDGYGVTFLTLRP